MKRTLTLLLGAVLAAFLCSCSLFSAGLAGDDSNETASPLGVPVKPLEVAEHDWWVSEGGKFSYVAVLKNPNDSLACLSPCLHVRIQHYDWSKAEDYIDVPLVVEPGSTVVSAGSWGIDGRGVASVDFVLDDRGSWEEVAPFSDEMYTVQNILLNKMLFDNSLTGELVCSGNIPIEGVGAVELAVVVRDSRGKIVGEATAFVDDPPIGRPVPFEAPLHVKDSFDDESCTYEIHARPSPPNNA
ncbi:hypothetical protein [Caniella muris]|uniref:hypothetical protein n=1 Tax=Caniella muris TaxID=2941502 RepID=UPI00203ACD77|nr:hypothetical protein [Caniella muris]